MFNKLRGILGTNMDRSLQNLKMEEFLAVSMLKPNMFYLCSLKIILILPKTCSEKTVIMLI